LIVSNHISWKDILVLGSVADVVFIAKSEVRQWPVFGWLARLAALGLCRSHQAAQDRERRPPKCPKRLLAGEAVVLFAEGTTSDGNRVMPFKSSLFGAASAGLPACAGQHRVTSSLLPLPIPAFTGCLWGVTTAPWRPGPGDVALGPHLLGVLREGALEVDVVFGEPIAFDAAADRKADGPPRRSPDPVGIAAALRGTLPTEWPFSSHSFTVKSPPMTQATP
jgi:1-acyl-sn-glycerol-3-phosphate acyltransferase